MIGAPSTLDRDKLRKVRALMTRGATAGERQAARTKTEAVAARAGMTLGEALSRLDAPAPAHPADFFAGFDDWMETREPGWKAAKAARLSERERRRLARCRELLAEFGGEEAVFAETEPERRLRLALEPLEADRHGLESYGDWISGNPTPAMWEAIARACPLPSAVPGVWAELGAWEALVEARIAFVPDYDAPACIRARQAALEHLMDTMPALSVEGLLAWLAWLAPLNDRETARDGKTDAALIATLCADFEAIAGGRPIWTAQHGRQGRRGAGAAVRRARPLRSGDRPARRGQSADGRELAQAGGVKGVGLNPATLPRGAVAQDREKLQFPQMLREGPTAGP